MRAEPALTYKGALAILGKYDSDALSALDALAGGFILASHGLPAIGAAWGMVDQKNEAAGLLRRLLNAAIGKALRTNGYHRRQLIAAAHTAIVADAFFEAVRQRLGRQALKEIALSKREKVGVLSRAAQEMTRDLLDRMYDTEIPMPSAARGFHENQPVLSAHLTGVCQGLADFMDGTSDSRVVRAAAETVRMGAEDLVGSAMAGYRDNYLRLMTDVPEFRMWVLLNEQAAGRDQESRHAGKILEALAQDRRALDRLHDLLVAMAGERLALAPPRETLRNANRTVLDDRVIPETSVAAVPGIVLPSVEEMYVATRFRRAVHDRNAQPSNDAWWRGRDHGSDFESLLAGQIASVDSFRLPILVLGQPGAGKSLLSKMLAAALPAEEYAVIRVPLRRVDAEAPVFAQVQQALDLATNGRLDWAALGEDSRDVVRVVILDGYDELLQASSSGRVGYLQDVEEFQRLEMAQHRPVVAIVTSRTVVADRIRIPAGCLMVKLDDFTVADIGQWVGSWNRVNRRAIRAQDVRPFPVELALDRRELAKQPLLLLMLALYVAEPSAPDLDGESSAAVMFQRLIEGFVRREVDKFHRGATDDVRAAEARRRIEDLTVAAFGMFNRGRVSVTEDDLDADLTALVERHRKKGRKAQRAARSIMGKFFFVHVAEANAHEGEAAERCYEFLHAMFGEYLIAADVVAMLERLRRRLADAADGERADDDRLFAMLSHQVLATRRSVLDLARELAGRFSPRQRDGMAELVGGLLSSASSARRAGQFAGYRPVETDDITALATYTANLVLLRTFLFGPMALDDLAGGREFWLRLMRLWRTGLDDVAWATMVEALELTGDRRHVRRRERRRFHPETLHLAAARLMDDASLEGIVQLGSAVRGLAGAVVNDEESRRVEDLEAALLFGILHDPAADAVRGILARYLVPAGNFRVTGMDHLLPRHLGGREGPIAELLSLYLLLNARMLTANTAEAMLAVLDNDGDGPERSLLNRVLPLMEASGAGIESLPHARPGLDDQAGDWMLIAVRQSHAESLSWLIDPEPVTGRSVLKFDPVLGWTSERLSGTAGRVPKRRRPSGYGPDESGSDVFGSGD